MQAWREENAPVIVAAEGFHLIDEEGHRYLDGHSSLWCNVHGHRVPAIDEAIRQQLDRVAHTTLLGLANDRAAELAAELVRRAPRGLNKVFFSDDGSTAIEAAMKIAWQYHRQKPRPEPRDLFVGLGGAYHGDTMGAVSVGGIDTFHAMYGGMTFSTLRVPSPTALRRPSGQTAGEYLAHCGEIMERTIEEHSQRIAAVIVEPLVQAAAGILVHPPGYLARLRAVTAQHGIPLIADEVAVGFGRTGTLFACEQEDVAPDLLCLSKGITGGYLPLAATLCTDEIESAFLGHPSEGRTFYHGHTYTGNPLACAAALASLRLFDENRVLDNVAVLADELRQQLALLVAHCHVAEIRQCGIMVGIEFVADRETLESFPLTRRLGHELTLACRRRGVILRNVGDVLVLWPAPAMPRELASHLVDVVRESVEEVLSKSE